MRLARILLSVFIFSAGIVLATSGFAASRTIHITHDPGGDLVLYEIKVQVARELKLQVIIDGVCASACTLFAGLPRSQICVTRRAQFHFHRARLKKPIPDGRRILQKANRTMFASYSKGVRQWIMQRGGLSNTMLRMQPREVARFFRSCDEQPLVS